MIILGRYKQCIKVNWEIKNHIDQNCMCVTTIFSNSVYIEDTQLTYGTQQVSDELELHAVVNSNTFTHQKKIS